MFRVDESSVFEVPGGKKVTFFKLNFRRGEKWVRAHILIIFEVGPGPAAAQRDGAGRNGTERDARIKSARRPRTI